MVADLTAEARTEAGLTGAVGAIRMGAVSTVEVAAGRGTRAAVEAGTLARVGRAAGISLVEVVAVGAAVDSAADVRRGRRRWRDREAGERLEAVHTVDLRVPREDMRRVPTAEATEDRTAATAAERQATAGPAMQAAATRDPPTAVEATRVTDDRVTATVATAAATADLMALRDPAELTVEAMARARVERMGIPTRVRAPDGTVVTTARRRIAAIRE